ncbi:MAG: ADP-ribosylation factor-like protein [Promethearchaeota archaeon]
MLRQVFVLTDKVLYRKEFGKALSDEEMNSVIARIYKTAFQRGAQPFSSFDYFQTRISYLVWEEKNAVFLFVTDLTDSPERVKKTLESCKREFVDFFEDIVGVDDNPENYAAFDFTVERLHGDLRPKISLVGYSGVGKTTISRLIRAEEIPVEHVPTITGDMATIKIGKLAFTLWDFAGQEQFSYLWDNFVKGSDAVLIVTDSTVENCTKSTFFTSLARKQAPYAKLAAIANKQDLPDALPVTEVDKMLGGGVKVYGMVATDPSNRERMITIIADVLEMAADVSPLLKPLIDRDRKLGAAERALQEGNLQLAAQLFNELGDLSLELGDDLLAQEFYEKAQKVGNFQQ